MGVRAEAEIDARAGPLFLFKAAYAKTCLRSQPRIEAAREQLRFANPAFNGPIGAREYSRKRRMNWSAASMEATTELIG